MARGLVAASTQYLDRAAAVLTGAPITVALWYYPTTIPQDGTLWLLYNSAGAADNNHLFALGQSSTGSNDLLAYNQAGAAATYAQASVAGPGAANGWCHAAGVWGSATSRIAYFNGSAGAEDTTSVTPAGIDSEAAGRLFYDGAFSTYLDGRLAELGVWSVALSAAEITSLALGFSPLLVRPASLVAYRPLIGRFSPEIDVRGGNNLTVTGATAAEHVRVINPAPPPINTGSRGQPELVFGRSMISMP